MNNAVWMTTKLITLPLTADIDSTYTIVFIYAYTVNTTSWLRRKYAFNICDIYEKIN